MTQYRLSVEAINRSSKALNQANTQNASAEDVLGAVGRTQERMGTAGHQADYWPPSKDRDMGPSAFAAADRATHINPAAPSLETGTNLEAVAGGQPAALKPEAGQSGAEMTALTRTASHAGNIALGSTTERGGTPNLEELGSILNPDDVLPERPFDASWAPQNPSSVQQGQASDIQSRLEAL